MGPLTPLRVAGWAADNTGCGYYRVGLPLHALAGRGHTTVASTVLPRDVAADPSWLVVGQRVANPPASLRWQRMARRRPVVYEIDDDLFGLSGDNPAAGYYAQPEVRRNIRRNAQVASGVTVTTEPLAEVMRGLNPNVTVIPNFVPAEILDIPVREPREGMVTIGWQGSPTHAADFMVARRALKRVLGPGVEIHFIGTSYATGLENTRCTPWIQDISAYHRAIDFDIGIAPLAATGFNQSKSNLRALEYAALGIPVVASDFGPYRGFVEHGVTGFLASTYNEWVDALRALINDPALRVSMGATARERARAWTVEGNAWRWEQVYRSVTPAIPRQEARL